jgi:hypothetical protein
VVGTRGKFRVPLARLGAVGSATILAVCLLAGTAGTAGASGGPTATFKLSGAGKGTLRTSGLTQCEITGGRGVAISDLTGSISGYKKIVSWSLAMSAPTAGAALYTVVPGPYPEGVLAATPRKHNGTVLQFNATSGTFRFNALRGSLDVTFESGKKEIRAKGTWNCQ